MSKIVNTEVTPGQLPDGTPTSTTVWTMDNGNKITVYTEIAPTGKMIRCTMQGEDVTPWIMLDPSREWSVNVKPPQTQAGAGTVRAEFTCSPRSLVQADNDLGLSNAIPVVWPAGDVAGITGATLTHAVAVRFASSWYGAIGELA